MTKSEIPKLDKLLQKNGKVFYCLARSKGKDGRDYAIYQVLMVTAKDELAPLGFETIRVMIRPACSIQGVDLPEHEGYPGDNEFGKNGWAYNTRELAESKYQELLKAPPSAKALKVKEKKNAEPIPLRRVVKRRAK